MTALAISRPDLPFRVRFAKLTDARAISQLYVRAYTPPDGGEARQHYPFPQIMEEERVVELITGGKVIWMVAEASDGTIAASAAALRNIGGPEDRVAEVFGVAVDQICRRRGVGSTLLQRLRAELALVAEFVLCEARTAEPGGWKAARNAGFQPVGFEPYAHAMPAGFESMVPTAHWNNRQLPPSDTGRVCNTRSTLRLTDVVCSSATADLVPIKTTDCELLERKVAALNGSFSRSLRVRRDDPAGRALFAGSTGAFDRQLALVEMYPIQGAEPHSRRFENSYYVAPRGTSNFAAARVSYDRIDARARILGLRGATADVERQFLEGVLENLPQLCGNGPLTVVTCVRAGNLAIQIGLEELGFIPTAYFPRMVSASFGRADVIQYTRLYRRSWAESIHSVTAMEWPEARRLIDQVVQTGLNSASVVD